MALLKIKCPECATDGTISFVERDYSGPYKCWKCHGLFDISIQDGQLKSCQPLSEEDLEKIKGAEDLRKKFSRSSDDDN